jgi:hypothetical protein
MLAEDIHGTVTILNLKASICTPMFYNDDGQIHLPSGGHGK